MRSIRLVAVFALAGILLVASVLPTAAQSGGPITLAGHDADDSVPITHPGREEEYAALFDALLDKVSNGGTGILAIGANTTGRAATWIQKVSSLMDDPQPVTFVNDAAISSQSFTGFAILFIPSDFADTNGGISAAENARLTARSADVAAFVNAGGGLFGLTQGELTDAYGYLADIGSFQTLSVPPSGEFPSGEAYDNVSATAEGQALGITNTNIDGCCWHTVFTQFPDFLKVLATANEPTEPPFHGEAAVLGGQRVVIPLAGRMTGGGSVFTATAQRVTHGFQLRCDEDSPSNRLEINWGNGEKFHLEQLTEFACSNDPQIGPEPPAASFDTYEGVGKGRYNGRSGASAQWTFVDAGEPGTADTAKLTVRDHTGKVVLEVSGKLNQGNHQAHR